MTECALSPTEGHGSISVYSRSVLRLRGDGVLLRDFLPMVDGSAWHADWTSL